MSTTSQRILVTGAGSGFGLGTVRRLAERGHHVIAGVLDLEQAAQIRKEFSGAQSDVEILKLDLREESDIRRAADLPFDVLVNNAGFGAQGPISESPLELVRATFEVNVFGTLNLTQRFLSALHRDGRPGRVVIVSSVAALLISPGAGAYSMSKHALDALAVELQQEVAGSSVSVHIVNPGPYSTGFNEKLVDNAPQALRTPTPDHGGLLGSQHQPDELVEVITNLADGTSSEARVILPTEFIDIASQYQQAQLGRS